MKNDEEEMVTEQNGEDYEDNDNPSPHSSEDETSDKESEDKKGENTISADLIRGHINTIILNALFERDKYGYEIINDIEEKSHGQYTLKQPTLYSALKRLENQGYIKAYWKTDEVTLGGRRKYFTLTDSGKEITEKNLAEWEYSRTIIDSLISDKSFDFNKPAPTPVDFHILKDSVSRVPIVKTAETTLTTEPVPPQKDGTVTEATAETKTEAEKKPEAAETCATPEVKNEVKAEAAEQQEQNNNRRIAHENYLKLISEPIPAKVEKTDKDDEVNADTERLLYNNRPETERDYKNLIDAIFNNALYNGGIGQTEYYPRQSQNKKPKTEVVTPKNSVPIVEKGRSDGVNIIPTSECGTTQKATKTTYDKGLTLLKSSLVVLAVLAVEFIFCLIFKDNLTVSAVYPTVILIIGILLTGVCLTLALAGYGKHAVRPTGNGYIGASVIINIIAILIITVLSFLLNMNATIVSDIMKMLVIPIITSLNITLFSVCFKLFAK